MILKSPKSRDPTAALVGAAAAEAAARTLIVVVDVVDRVSWILGWAGAHPAGAVDSGRNIHTHPHNRTCASAADEHIHHAFARPSHAAEVHRNAEEAFPDAQHNAGVVERGEDRT